MSRLQNIDTVWLDEKENLVCFIDQTRLPNDVRIKKTNDEDEMYEAIYRLEVRGAPAIGVFAALCMYVLAENIDADSIGDFLKKYDFYSNHLNSSRPTAVNLSWALDKMQGQVNQALENIAKYKNLSWDQLATANFREVKDDFCLPLKNMALSIYNDDIATCKKIGQFGAQLIPAKGGLLTHCNAGKLATVRYGTATAPMYVAHEMGRQIHVYCDETRPILQGARLTAFELSDAGIDTTLLCDNMAASLMKEGKIQAVFVGADRIAANGDTANKIGTSAVAIIAKHYGVPFYVCAPTSTIDIETKTGADIPIEFRHGDEVTKLWYEKPMSAPGVKVYNPAFDVTDHDLITGIVTERGVIKAPFTENINKIIR